MVSLASSTVVPRKALGELCTAAVPKKSLFGRQRDRFREILDASGTALPPFSGDGQIVAVALNFLESRGIFLTRSDFSIEAHQIAKIRGGHCYFLTATEKAEYHKQLTSPAFTASDMRSYYEEVYEFESPGIETTIAEGIRYLARSLGAASTDRVVLLEIGG